MDRDYPHWYGDKQPCPSDSVSDCQEQKCLHAYPGVTLKDRLLLLLGDRVLFSVDAPICHHTSLIGLLCYVGTDFIIVNSRLRCKPIALHVPIDMIRFITPYKCKKYYKCQKYYK